MNDQPPGRLVDALVVGGGPVGLVTALECARRGLEVVVVERRSGVVDKACGEGIMSAGVDRLRSLAVDPPGRDFHAISYLSADGSVHAEAPLAHPGRGVRRTVLHESLLDATARAAVPVVRARVTDVHQARTSVGVRAVVERRELIMTARYVVGADGLHSRVRRAIGVAGRPSGARRHGIRRHVALPPWSENVEVYWSAAGEAYVTPVSEDEVGVAMLTTLARPFEDLLESFPALTRRLGGARATSTVRAAGPLRQRVTRRVRHRVLLVGDAAGYVDALTGDGLTSGFAQAAAVADAVARDAPRRYELTWRRAALPPAVAAWALVNATRSPEAKLRVPELARAQPALFRSLVRHATR